MAVLLCGAALLRQLASKLHRECKKPASSVSAPAPAPAAASVAVSSPAAGPGVSSAAAAASSAAVSGLFSASAAPTAVLRAAAAAARAASIIPRKALPSIPFCSDQEHTLAKLLGMKAPPASYWTLPPVNPSRISALSRDGNPPAACSSLLPIEEDEEPLPEPTTSSDDDRLSLCFSSCSSLRPSDRGTDELPPVDPLFRMLWAQLQKEVGAESDDDDDDDEDHENCSCTSCLHEHQVAQERCSAFLGNLSAGALAREIESMLPSSSVPLSSVTKDKSEPVGVEQDLDSPILLKPAPLSIRKKVAETPPVVHPEPKRVLVTYPRGAHRSLHPALEALCLHLNA